MTKTVEPKPKKIRTLAQDVMSSELVVLKVSNTYRDAIELLTQHHLTVIPVVSKEGKLLGLLTEKEVLGACESFNMEASGFLDKIIKFNRSVQTAQLDTSIAEIKKILATESFRHLPITDSKGMLMGIITRRDLIRVIYLRIEIKKQKTVTPQRGQLLKNEV